MFDLNTLREVYYALSDDVRLTILKLLLERGELCVCQIQPILKISQPNLSFHLRVLRDAKLVKWRRKGKKVFYTLNLENPVLRANLPFLEALPSEKLQIQLKLV